MALIYVVPTAVVGAVMLAIFLTSIPMASKDYALEVDAFKDNDDMMLMYRVVIVNTGRNDVTNVVVDYGTYKDFIPRIKPGEKIILSPRDDASKEKVTVTAEPSIYIVKEYRNLAKMVKVH
ncbi:MULTISPECIES: hypothetical protein [Candidatus Nitrosocaldus]|jgi:hypothetical protein|uniref:Uncharacterized protein n=1 Tax=Candidatus Nitrosocaldus cavascurensis TaxID=2058097 RepID=A0A2K5ASP6_9ARCH|nr:MULTISPECIES: hypothetical protein [Candidatus Nitrosocaldus]GBC74265.1 hypothetical protein HRbin05_00300 [archaeon HR05]SPC34668.1 conserved exported protein of unknown function [Candidatus Nitrosocaldus cavascurensis]